MIVTCGHCKHWHEFSGNRGRGMCQIISGNYKEETRSLAASTYTSLYTHHDFGCTLGEAKEPTKEDA